MSEKNIVPAHVSIIMDGNGRWASERGLPRVKGHFEGVKSVRACTETAVRMGVKYLSLFAFSEENWGRPQEEVNTLMGLMMKCMEEEMRTIMDNNVRFMVIGNRERLSPVLNESIAALEKMSAGNTAMTLIVFLSYSGKWDILQATKKLVEAGNADFTQQDLENNLMTAGIPDPDLIIRTSGEKRLSNYLLWQAAYSEFVFADTLWPDFREKDFEMALEEYAKRDRRYGKVK